jgi:hypothetical protein
MARAVKALKLITANRTRTICRLHALLCLLIEGGTGRAPTAPKAAQLLASVPLDGAITIERVAVGTQAVGRDPGPRCRSCRCRKHTVSVITASATTVTDIHGIGPLTAAIIIESRRRHPPVPDRRALRPPQRHRTDRSVFRAEEAAPVEPAR